MNYLLQQLNYHKSLLRVITNNAEALDGKTELTAALETYAATTDRLTEITSGLVYPVTFVRRERVTYTLLLREEVRRMSDLGCLIAKKHNDPVMLSKMRDYRTMSYKLSAFKLFESAFDISDVLETFNEDATSLGFTVAEVTAFRTLAQQLSDSMTGIRGQLDDRRNNRLEIRNLFKVCTSILREHFDPFVRFNGKAFPDFAAAYDLQRKKVVRRKKPTGTTDDTGEISGTAFNSDTSEPVANATVTITEFNLVTQTDEDGYYIFEGLAATTYRIGCAAPGFDVPAVQLVTLTSGDSLDVDFMLVPVQTPVENVTT
jgi:hypothetical protein